MGKLNETREKVALRIYEILREEKFTCREAFAVLGKVRDMIDEPLVTAWKAEEEKMLESTL